MNFRDITLEQGGMCEALGSPFMNLLLSAIADNIAPGHPITDRLLTWEGDISARGHSVPLRLAGALHALVLTGRSPQLVAAYPPNKTDPDTLWAAVEHAFATHTDHIQHWLDNPPQTNEIRRSTTLIPAAHLVAGHFGKPLALSELGASGGLNLMFDHFELQAGATRYLPDAPATALNPDWSGDAPDPANLKVVERRGVDLNPLNPQNPNDQLRLRAYLWPDQTDRMRRTEAAISVASGTVDMGDVEAWLRARLQAPPHNATHFIYHTIAWQYFPAATSAACQAFIEEAGANATLGRPLAWFGMEGDNDFSKGAKLTLRLWPGDLTLHLGRADFHGRWVKWSGETP